MLRIGGGIRVLPFVAIAAGVFLALLLLWVVATEYDGSSRSSCPSPGRGGGTGWAARRARASSGRTSASRLPDPVGFAIATALALPIGVLIGGYRFWEAAIEPLVDFIRYMPVVAFVPLTILWAGTGDAQKFLIIFIGTFFQQVLLIMDNAKRVPLRPRRHRPHAGDAATAASSPGSSSPAASPAIWDSMRISLGWAWTWLVLAELVAATSGLGYRITTAQRFFQTDTIIGYLLLLGLLGLLTDQAMKASGGGFFGWAEARR